jgi:hypothetical protein
MLFQKLILIIVISVLISFPLASMGFVVNASSDDWPMFRSNPSHTGIGTGDPVLNGTLLWKYFIGDLVFVTSSPAVVNGVVYVGSRDDNVYALNATDGAKLWNYTTGAYVWSSPAVVNGVVYVGSADGYVYAFVSSPVIPEFPIVLLLPTFMLATLVAFVIWKRKRPDFSGG